jgi:hypothetical protein
MQEDTGNSSSYRQTSPLHRHAAAVTRRRAVRSSLHFSEIDKVFYLVLR